MMRIDVERRFGRGQTRRTRSAFTPAADYVDYPAGYKSRPGLIAQTGLARRDAAKAQAKTKLKQVSKVGNTGFLAIVDKFFVQVNGYLGQVGL